MSDNNNVYIFQSADDFMINSYSKIFVGAASNLAHNFPVFQKKFQKLNLRILDRKKSRKRKIRISVFQEKKERKK